MARRLLNGPGDLDNASIWDQESAAATLHASTNLTLTSSPLYSDTFTAPSTSDFATAVTPVLINYSGSGNLVATLQEYDGATWNDVATATKALADLSTNCLEHLRLSVPYQFTTTTTDYYRWKFTQTGTNVIMAASSGETEIAVISWDDRHVAPTAGDDLYFLAYSTTRTRAKVVGTEACGSGTSPATSQTYRTFDASVYVGAYGSFECDTAADSKLENKGHIVIAKNGYWDEDLSSYPNITFTLEMEHDTADGDFGITIEAGPALVNMKGRQLTNGAPNYASGDGSTGSKLTVDQDISDWKVDDRLLITSTNTYDEVEEKYIKTISAGEITLADSPGGAESALSHTHTTRAVVVNCERNVIVTAKNASYGYYFLNENSDENASVTIDDTLFEYCGGTAATRRGIQIKDSSSRYVTSFDGNVCWQPVDVWGFGSRTSRVAETYTGLIQYGGQYVYMAAKNETYDDLIAIATSYMGVSIINSNVILNDPIINGANTSDNQFGGGIVQSNSQAEINNADVQACRRSTVVLAGVTNTTYTTCNLGDLGGDEKNIRVGSDTFNDALFDSCYFDTGLDKVDSGYEDMVVGSRIAFHRYGATDNKHFMYEPGGIKQSTGAGLDDTEVYDAGSLAMRMAPNNATDGVTHEFKVLCKVGKSVGMYGRIMKNATMATDEVRVELWLPQSTSADEVAYMPSDSNWNVFSLFTAYAGSVPALATIKIIGISATAGAYAYVDALFNGTDEVNGLDLWEKGSPSEIIYPEIGNPEDVWAQASSTLTTAGTIGKLLAKALTVGKFLGLK